MQPQELFALVFVAGMFAGVFVIVMAMRQRSQQLEMLHRERMAMIERGQNPVHASSDGATWRGGGSAPASRREPLRHACTVDRSDRQDANP